MKCLSIWTRRLAPALVPALAVVSVACGTVAGAADVVPPENPADTPAAITQIVAPAEHAGTEAPASMSDLDADAIVAAFEDVLHRVYQESLPSVVHIRLEQQAASDPRSPFGRSGGQQAPDDFFFSSGEGSGFVWSDEGHIVTNQHVVADADRVTVIFSDGFEVEADVLGGDPDSDLAVLRVDVSSDRLVPVKLGDSDTVMVGQMAIAIGNPFGQEFTTTSGIVSAVGRTIQSGNSRFSIPEVIQTDASINPGNSGGPLLDRTGSVIGINTQIISRSGSSAGVGFAVPINTAKRVVSSLIDDGRYRYSWLGISGAPVRPEVADVMGLPDGTRGAYIIEVINGGPADDAGIRGSTGTSPVNGTVIPVGGDVIVAMDGEPIESMDDLIAYMVDHTRPGDEVQVSVLRSDGVTAELTVVLGTRPPLTR